MFQIKVQIGYIGEDVSSSTSTFMETHENDVDEGRGNEIEEKGRKSR